MSLLENDSGDDGEVRHKRFDYPAPSLPGMVDFFIKDGITDVQAAILLNQTPQEIHQMKKHIRCYLRAPCPWITPDDLTTDDDTMLCRKDEHPLGWMMPAGKQGELFRHLVIPPVAKLYPDLFVEPDLETQIRQDQANTYGRFQYAPFVVRKEVLTRMIESCAQDMRAIPCLRDADTESQHQTPRPKLKRCRIEGWELNETNEQPELKRQLIMPFNFAHIKAVATSPPADIPRVKSDLETTPSTSVKSKPISESSRRGPSTVAELLEQERAVRAQSRKRSTSSTSSVITPSRGERADREIVEKRRLWISNMPSWTRKRDVADFFIGHNIGLITQPEKFMGSSSCFASFYTHEQAKRAMEAMDGLPLLGREIEIEYAKEPIPTMVGSARNR
ncbi:hypothetical protein E4T50_08599 [Aureobasidium sp. EXF-12298]|nr:hypothetical protein E4T50_08599 [Aureobasidium sp. EXF-12298]